MFGFRYIYYALMELADIAILTEIDSYRCAKNAPFLSLMRQRISGRRNVIMSLDYGNEHCLARFSIQSC